MTNAHARWRRITAEGHAPFGRKWGFSVQTTHKAVVRVEGCVLRRSHEIDRKHKGTECDRIFDSGNIFMPPSTRYKAVW
ncbi:hypothetical protein WOLCODRAFT_152296 [Wolfiporia cocos MD-104 SS10]|uniref:Uncharacterized protein n=1 Tax=Wolfiporia cocos (strain MD-104) TaxID=742152 RepID=A0A2H3JZT1_WOLCO|nr:hypothetical protein WOLCODRAFT_152296 [Wolfiporia cocos MD-104 SS10]